MTFGALLSLGLICFGLVRFPQTLSASRDGIKGLAADLFILALYAAVGIVGAPRTFETSPQVLKTGIRFGLAVAIVYAAVVEGEYLFRFDESGGRMLGVSMVAAAFTLFLLAGARAAYLTGRAREGALAAMWSAAIGTLIWFCLVMLTYFAFLGTAQQDHVLRVENQADFVRSGMTDFRAFIMQDFMGACFFHLLISPAFALVLGSAGGIIGFIGYRIRGSREAR